MPPINLDQAKEFLNEIKNSDKVTIIHHDDTDGFVSGILLYDFLKKKGIETKHSCFSIGANQKDLIEETVDSNIILISDLGANTIVEMLEAIKEKKVLYIDHHKRDTEIPSEILEYRTESKISASKSVFAMTGGKKWLEISALLSDAGYSFPEYKEQIEKFAKEENLEIEEFLNKYYFRIDLFLAYHYKDINNAFEILKNIQNIDFLKKYSDVIEKEVERLIKDYEKNKERLGKVNYYFFESKYPLKSRITTEISFKYPSEAFVFAMTDIKTKKGLAISARNQSGEVDCVELLKNATRGLKDALAGGHAKAAGGHIRKEDLEEFKRRLSKRLF